MQKIQLKSVIWKEGKHYIAQCLDVDVCSFGKTKKEATAMLLDALNLYFEDMPLPKKKEQVKDASVASLTLQHA